MAANQVWSVKDALAVLALAISLLVSGKYAGGRQFRPAVERGRLTFTLRVYNYVIPRNLLSDAEADATVILNAAGFDPVWVDCPPTGAGTQDYPSCEPAIGPSDFILTIVTKAGPERVLLGEDAMGRALPCSKKQMACSAYIFYKDVQDEAAYAKVNVSRLLGHVFAHEIGHLLLGPNSHSITGIMMAGWSDEDMQTISRSCLFFTQKQARRMQDEILARRATEQAR